jgi:CBS domain containing-hemolysin-like protein
MAKKYGPLPTSGLRGGVGFHKPSVGEHRPVTLDDPATLVMTDFKRVRALTITRHASMQDALDKMMSNGVRLLLVVDGKNAVIGLITSTDLTSEKPVRVIEERRIGRQEVQVGDIMTPRERLEAVDMDDLVMARVGHVVNTLQSSGRRHALVVDTGEDGVQAVRGLFSATQIERQLGMTIETLVDEERRLVRIPEPITQ